MKMIIWRQSKTWRQRAYRHD